MKAVGYVRVSTEEQEEGYSLEAQERSIRALSEARGWTLIRIYRDEGLSAYRDVRRPEYEAMIAAMAEWDVVIVWKLNRLHRTMRGFVRDALALRDAGKGLVSVTESIDTSTATGALMFHILGAFSEFESAQTAERVKLAFREKFEDGESTWYTRPPIGYDLIEGKLELNPAEAETVRYAFARIIEGARTDKLAIEMNKRGMRGKQGGRWAQVSIIQIVHNPVYAGYVYYNGEVRRNGHEAIVSDETFNDAQMALYVRTRKGKRWPFLAGPARVAAMSVVMSGRGARVYRMAGKPAGFDAALARAVKREAARRQ